MTQNSSNTSGKWNIKKKVIMLMALTGLIPFLIFFVLSMTTMKREILKLNENRLTALKEDKKYQIERYFQQIRDQVLTMSESRMIIEAIQEFNPAFFSVENELSGYLDSNKTSKLKGRYTYQLENTPGAPGDSDSRWFPRKGFSKILQSLYISENSQPIGEKHNLMVSNDESQYSKVHAKYHPAIKSFLEKFGYYDIFLVEPKTGHIIYSVFKEVDYTTSLLSGPYADTGIGRVFKKALSSDNASSFVMDDFAPYEPSYNSPASFIASPIYDGPIKVGVLIFQMPIDKIDDVMSSNHSWKKVGLGESGEAYLIGPDKLMRNNSRFLIENAETYYKDLEGFGVDKKLIEDQKTFGTSIGLMRVDSKGVKEALNGISGFQIFKDYRGIPVLSAYSPLDILGLRWAILAEIDEEEAFAVQASIRNWNLITGVFIAFAIFWAGFFIAKKAAAPILKMVKATQDIARGHLKSEKLRIESDDELGELAKNFNSMSEGLRTFIQNSEEIMSGQSHGRSPKLQGDFAKSVDNMMAQAIEKQKANEAAEVAAEETARMHEQEKTHAEKLRKSLVAIESNAKALSGSSGKLSEVSVQMSSNAEETSAQSSVVSDASKEVSKNVELVSLSVEEMNSSIREIAQNANEAATVANDAVAIVESTNVTISKLGESSNEIGQVVKVINSIAEQTNLLALNATIEAARAGEAGKGFAVVANEVKELAKETSKATGDIGSRIEAIQSDTENAVQAITEVTSVINKINDISNTIATAVEEQTATTAEMGRTVSEAARGTEEINNNINGVAQAAQTTNKGAADTQLAAGELATMAGELQRLVSSINAA